MIKSIKVYSFDLLLKKKKMNMCEMNEKEIEDQKFIDGIKSAPNRVQRYMHQTICVVGNQIPETIYHPTIYLESK